MASKLERNFQRTGQSVTERHLATTPDTSTPAREKRLALRSARSGPIWWKEGLRGDVVFGWMLEHSRLGAAFLARGAGMPLAGTKIQTSDETHASANELCRDAFVKRVEPIHADLYLVAIQYADNPVPVPN